MAESTEPASAPHVTRDWLTALAVGLGAVFGLLPALGDGSLFDSDDAIYAQMAREMAAAGEWFDNRWCGAVQFEKPPLLLWLLRGAMALFGEGEAALRLPATVSAAVALGAMVWLIRGLGGSRRRAVLGALLLGTSSLFVLLSRRVMTDLPLLAALLAAAALMVRGRAGWAGVAVGLAVLAKGPAAGPIVVGLLGVSVWARWLTGRAVLTLCGTALLVAAPWHLIETIRHGAEFWRGYVGYHAFARASSSVVPGASMGSFLGAIGGEFVLVGAAFLGGALWMRRGALGAPFVVAMVWLLCAALPPLMSTTRLVHYALPVLPGLALLAVLGLPNAIDQHRLFGLTTAGLAALALATGSGTLAFWLRPDFGPSTKMLGETLRGPAFAEAAIATGDVGDQALTWYSGRCVPILAVDPRFREIQEAVLMNTRAGVVMAPPGPLSGASRVALVVRKGSDPMPFLGPEPRRLGHVDAGALTLWTDVRPEGAP